MATLVKSKKREKKKNKQDKNTVKTLLDDEIKANIDDTVEVASTSKIIKNEEIVEDSKINDEIGAPEVATTNAASVGTIVENKCEGSHFEDGIHLFQSTILDTSNNDAGCKYNDLSDQLKLISLPKQYIEISETRTLDLENPNAYIGIVSESQSKENVSTIPFTATTDETYSEVQIVENAIPSAPIIENIIPNAPLIEEEVQPKLQCMTLEDAVKLYAGKEIATVKAMSEREEAIVEAGPTSGPEHPLVDLLSTFRTSLMALDRERVRIANGFVEEARIRGSLWKTEKRWKTMRQNCKCGTAVDLKISYDYAELSKDRLPAAKMKLQKLLRDVQDCYCHHQHVALLTHYQIEITISDITQCSKAEIREALFLMLQALKMSGGAPDALPVALVRWALVLSAACMDGRDLGHLLFLMHLLFRQSRSVRWASQVIHVPLSDNVDAARTLALLDILLNNCKLETAVECSEETTEEWEEISMCGTGAVSEGTLRERDLLSLFNALPLRGMLAKILLFNDADIRTAHSEWWGDSTGGRATLAACCGVRALLSCLRAPSHYAQLRARLRTIAAAAMKGLACLYQSPRKSYEEGMKERILAEMEACFATGFPLFEKEELCRLPTSLLSDAAARDYCFTLISGLHEIAPKRIERLNVDVPEIPCDVKVRAMAAAAADRAGDSELAAFALDFLFQIGMKKKIEMCKGGCEIAARESVEVLLATHSYLYPVALRIMADVYQVETLDPSLVSSIHVDKWRPGSEEMGAVLEDWAQRCPLLLPHLLLSMDFTPFTGLPLEIQVQIGKFLQSNPVARSSDWRWCVIQKLRTHRSCWRLPLDAPPPDFEPNDLFDKAFALLATSWGHSIPLICSVGVEALAELCRARVALGAHCAAFVMYAMATSPDSISHTPKFGEVFASLASQSPSLLSRAFGRAAVSGSDLLMRLVLSQVEGPPVNGVSMFPAWLHALCPRVGSPFDVGALKVLETAAIASRDWPTLHAHAINIMQDPNASSVVTLLVKHASIAPLVCEVFLRAYHSQECNTQLFPLLQAELSAQRAAGKKIHVDNALQKLGARVTAEELSVYRCASAAMAAPAQHPAHLAVWTMLLHLYLHRPSHRTDIAVGPLFFSGLIKTRMLAQIKKKLQETIAYHHEEAATAKTNLDITRKPKSSSRERSQTKTKIEFFPPLTVKDLTSEDKAIDTDSEDSGKEDGSPEPSDTEDEDIRIKQVTNMMTYHSAAERLLTEYLGWLEANENVKALPHHADLARVIPNHALEEAWQTTLSTMRPQSSDAESFPTISDPPPNVVKELNTPFDIALDVISTIKDKAKLRSKPTLKSCLEDINFNSKSAVISVVEKYFKDIDRFAKEWCQESDRVVALDIKLWDYVANLKTSRPISQIKRHCANKCRHPVTFVIDEYEYVTNSSAEEAVKENRESARQAIRRISNAKPQVARAIANLLAIVKRIRDYDVAVEVLKMTWRYAGQCNTCPTIQEAISNVFTTVAQQWITSKGGVCADLIGRWCRGVTSPLQQALIGSLVSPRSVPHQSWAPLYFSVITATLPPHIVFSCLSKFEMSKWMQVASESERRELQKAIIDAAQRQGPLPPDSYNVVLELAGVHVSLVATPQTLPELILLASKAATNGKLPPIFWPHIITTTGKLANGIHFDGLGHLLRSLGEVWKQPKFEHATYVSDLVQVLVRSFVRAGVELSYEPARVGWYAWGALLEAWQPWLVTDGPLIIMLLLFVDTILQIMTECPGSEIRLLQLVFEWAVASRSPPPLLVELSRLPWDQHQWFSTFCLQFGLQLSNFGDTEFTSWAKSTWRATKAETLVELVPPEQLTSHLTHLLYFYTSIAHHIPQFVEEGARLPWNQLPEQPFSEALDRFFIQHSNPAVPYHELPQFTVFLYASELKLVTDEGRYARSKRSQLISQWTCSSASPVHLPQLTSHVTFLLDLLNQIAPKVRSLEEMEEYLSRALIIMCTEPSGTNAIRLWCEAISNGCCDFVRAAVMSSASLTVPKYAAKLSEVAVKSLLNSCTEGWDWISNRWHKSTWRSAMTFVSREALHSGYIAAVTTPTQHTMAPLLAIQNTKINFIEDEIIVAVWVCFACRVVRECLTDSTDINDPNHVLPTIECSNPEAVLPVPSAQDSLQAARKLLRNWATPPRRSILKMITLKVDTDVPTPQHRLLALLAQCTIDPSPPNVHEYETICHSVLGNSANEFVQWGKTADLTKLLALANRLYPNSVKYFQFEMNRAQEYEGR